MRIVLEIPTNRPDSIPALIRAASESKDVAFALALNGSGFEHQQTIEAPNLIGQFVDQAGPVSMMWLRFCAAKIADTFNPQARVLADDNFIFREGWSEYLLDSLDKLEEFIASSGKQAILGMSGSLGGSRSGPNIMIGVNPMIETDKGIMYVSRHIWEGIEFLPGGFEDYYFTSHAIKVIGCVPLKRFFSRIQHPRKRTIEHTDYIHDRSVWEQFNMSKVREIWDDHLWTIPLMHRHLERKGVPKGEPYFYKQPKKTFRFMCELRQELSQIPSVSHLIIDGYEDKKWRNSMGISK